MLDILANNDWKRPIYFTGGSYADAEYLWMKEYLQLEGLVYKLVPIKTPLNPINPYLMGRIDADRMYTIVQQWEWGNGNSPDIYHDPETRKTVFPTAVTWPVWLKPSSKKEKQKQRKSWIWL